MFIILESFECQYEASLLQALLLLSRTLRKQNKFKSFPPSIEKGTVQEVVSVQFVAILTVDCLREKVLNENLQDRTIKKKKMIA